MNRFLIRLLALFVCAVSLSCRHEVKEDFVTAPNAQPGSEYPMVNSERRVRVRVHAPYALSVKLDICAKLFPLRRVDGGFWIGESEPLDEGFHYYRLIVDGGRMPDPSCQFYYGASYWCSGVDIPAPDDEIYAERKVPQGELRGTYYWSEKKQAMRHIFVYTPAEYDRNPDKRYPVLYLLPGGAESEYSWARQGHISQIMDNLIADGKAVPFLVVMDNCLQKNPVEWEEDYNSILVNDLIPMIDSTYRTIPDKDHRAMAGLSYGGLQTKWTVFAHPELFCAAGSFSGGSYTKEELASHPGFAENVKLVFVSFGETELTYPIFGIEEGTDPRKETEELKDAGVDAHFYLSPRTHHEWHSWRRSMYEFAQLLFK